MLCWGSYLNHHYSYLNKQATAQLTRLDNKLADLKRLNTKTLYFPKPGEATLNANQIAMVRWLTNSFSDWTTYNGSTKYSANYQQAKASIHDPSFFRDYLEPPVNKDGENQVKVLKTKSQNVAVQVIPTGDDNYEVFVLNVMYIDRSDLYQYNKLHVHIVMFDITGTPGNVTKAAVRDDIQRPYLTVSDLGNLK